MKRSHFSTILGVFVILAFLFSPLAHSYQDTADPERILNERIATNPKDYVAMTDLGNIYLEKGERKKAIRLFNKAVKIAPDYPPAHLVLGRAYFLMQKPDEAVAEFKLFKEKMLVLPHMERETKKFYIESLHYICDVYFTLKRYDDFKQEIDEILRLDLQDQQALYNLGVYYYTYEHSKSKAYQLFKKSTEIDNNSYIAKKARYAIEYIRTNPDSRIIPDFSFIDKEYRD